MVKFTVSFSASAKQITIPNSTHTHTHTHTFLPSLTREELVQPLHNCLVVDFPVAPDPKHSLHRTLDLLPTEQRHTLYILVHVLCT